MRRKKTEAGDDLITTAETRRVAGDISPTTIWRGCKAGTFPKPAGYLLGRKVWRRRDVIAWREAQLVSLGSAEAERVRERAAAAREGMTSTPTRRRAGRTGGARG